MGATQHEHPFKEFQDAVDALGRERDELSPEKILRFPSLLALARGHGAPANDVLAFEIYHELLDAISGMDGKDRVIAETLLAANSDLAKRTVSQRINDWAAYQVPAVTQSTYDKRRAEVRDVLAKVIQDRIKDTNGAGETPHTADKRDDAESGRLETQRAEGIDIANLRFRLFDIISRLRCFEQLGLILDQMGGPIETRVELAHELFENANFDELASQLQQLARICYRRRITYNVRSQLSHLNLEFHNLFMTLGGVDFLPKWSLGIVVQDSPPLSCPHDRYAPDSAPEAEFDLRVLHETVLPLRTAEYAFDIERTPGIQERLAPSVAALMIVRGLSRRPRISSRWAQQAIRVGQGYAAVALKITLANTEEGRRRMLVSAMTAMDILEPSLWRSIRHLC